MASYSLYRKNPEGDVIGILKGRRGLLDKTQTANGKSASVRNPAWASITGHDKSCDGDNKSRTLPIKQETWDEVYKPNIKPSPDLVSVTIEYGGDWGLARKVSAEIRCYSIEDFLWVQQYFLLPGNVVDVSFGYSNSWGVGQDSVSLKGFKVAVFAFNTTTEGFWICTFTAVSASTAIKNLDMQAVVCNGCNPISGNGSSGNDGPIKYFTGKPQTKNAVKGIAQLIAADAQINGTISIDDARDGEVIDRGKLVNYSPGEGLDGSAAIVLYTGDHMRKWDGKLSAWAGGILAGLTGTANEVETSNNQVYVTLGYIVNRIINDQLLRAMTCGIGNKDRKDFNDLKIDFDKKYSKCQISPSITSGDPLTMLLLGKGNYKNSSGDGKDFDADCKSLETVKSALGGGEIKLQNILLHRDVVMSAFNAATKPKESNSDQTDVKNSGDQVVNISDFFGKIADHISSCVGGAISLRLVEHPEKQNILIVVDQNYGVADKLDVVIFDPIDGDGSTRSCEVASNVGSQEYRASMFVGSSKKGDPVSALRGCEPERKTAASDEWAKAKLDFVALVRDPGNLGTNAFNGQDINALKSIMGRLHRNNPYAVKTETVHYPGLSISIELDGIWGYMPGNGISSTQVPNKWRTAYNSYFMVTRVTQQIQDSDWTTKIEGILAYYDNINYIPL
jgi:hypothetical protein